MSSVNKHIDALRVFLIWLSKKGEYPNCYNIHTSVRRVNEGDKVSRNIFTRKELSALFNRKAENPSEFMMKAIFVILYASGLRCGELLSMKLSDIDEAHFFENKEAVVYEPKTRKERIVQFGEVGAAYLRLYLENIRPKAEQRRSSGRIRSFVYNRQGAWPDGCSICEQGVKKVRVKIGNQKERIKPLIPAQLRYAYSGERSRDQGSIGTTGA